MTRCLIGFLITLAKRFEERRRQFNIGLEVAAEHDSCKILAHWLLRTPRGPQNPE
jgi:hypothetical protein